MSLSRKLNNHYQQSIVQFNKTKITHSDEKGTCSVIFIANARLILSTTTEKNLWPRQQQNIIHFTQ